MAEGKKGFVLYADYQELVEALNDKDAGQLFKHIFKYVNDERPPTSKNKMLQLAFIPIKRQLKRDLLKYEKNRKQRVAAGKASVKARQQKATSVNDRSTKRTVIGKVIVKGKGKVIDKVKVRESKSTPLTGYGIKNYEILKEIEADWKWDVSEKFDLSIKEIDLELKGYCKFLSLHGEIRKTVKDFKSHYVNLKNKRPDFLSNGKEIDWDKI